MVLEDLKVMRTHKLRKLNQAITVYQQYISEETEDLMNPEIAQACWEKETDLIAQIHEATHQLSDSLSTDILLAYTMAGTPLKELPKLPLAKPIDALLDFNKIQESLPLIARKTNPGRQAAATYLVDDLMSYVRKQLGKVRQPGTGKLGKQDEEVKARGILEFLIVVSHYDDKYVTDSQSAEGLAKEMWDALDDIFRRELKEMIPPLTWGETLYHYLRNLEDNRGDPDINKQRILMGEYLFPVRKFYCLRCDRPFEVDSRHPGRFICKRCRATERKRRERQRKRDNTSS